MKKIQSNPKLLLVLLWITVLFNMVFADIFSIMVEFVNGDTIEIPFDVLTVMAIAALVSNIPILMILMSWILPHKMNKWTNIIASILTILYIIGGGSLLPHYLIIGTIEVVLLIIVMVVAFRWKD